MKKVVAWLMLLTVLTLFTFGAATATVRADPVWKTLYAGKDINVGGVRIWNDADNLYVMYSTLGTGWEITETHLAVNTSIADIPQTKTGNPKVGHFPYQMTHDPPVERYTYTIPLEWAAGTKLYIAAHAVVQNGCQEETAWADCEGPTAVFPGRNWATYVTYTVQAII
jgi:hypothetical protein